MNDCWNRIGIRGDASCPELLKHIHCHHCPVYSSSAAELLDRPIPPGYLREWTAQASQPVLAAGMQYDPLLVFSIGDEMLALPLHVCQEVTQPLSTHSIPFRRGGYILGLVNVRGELVISVSIEQVLGLARAEDAPSDPGTGMATGQFRRLVVILYNGARFAFPATKVFGTHYLDRQQVQEVPETLARSSSHYVSGIVPYDGKHAGLIDHELLFYTLGRGLS